MTAIPMSVKPVSPVRIGEAVLFVIAAVVLFTVLTQPVTTATTLESAFGFDLTVGNFVANNTCVTTQGTWRLNVRTGPGMEYPVIRSIANHTIVEPIGDNNQEWLKIGFEGRNGWVFEEFTGGCQ